MRGLVLVASLAACGRIHFDPLGGGGGGDGGDGDGSGDGGGSMLRDACALMTDDSDLGIDGFTIDGDGNAYVVVEVSGSFTVGGQVFTNGTTRTLFAVSLDPHCGVRWVHPFPITTAAGIVVTGRYTIVVDSTGNTTLAGDFEGSIDPGDGPHASGSPSTSDAFVVQLDPAGAFVWFQRLGGSGGSLAGGMALGAQDSLVVGGNFSGTINLGAGNVTSAGGDDLYVVGYSHTGVIRAGERFGGTGDEYLARVALDGAGTTYGAGDFTGATNLGTGPHNSAGGDDTFAARYSATFAPQLGSTYGGAGNDFAFAVAVDASSQMTIAGEFDGPVNFGTGLLTPGGMRDVFVMGVAATGTARWVRQFGGTAEDECESLAIDSSGDVIASGMFGGTVDFGQGSVTVTGESGFVVGLASDGTTRWVVTLEASGNANAYAVAAMPGGGAAVAGAFHGTLPIAGATLQSGAAVGVFVAQVR